MYVIFGRPGSGKTTIADEVVKQLDDECVAIDLDVCVPKTLRDNFAIGVYPTSKEREEFMNEACSYVESLLTFVSPSSKSKVCIISFSFVNDDLRQVFRHRFSSAHWILIDTPTDIANKRIIQRQGHFYKVTSPPSAIDVASPLQSDDKLTDSSTNEWDFADINFDHSKIDGTEDIHICVQQIKSIILSTLQT